MAGVGKVVLAGGTGLIGRPLAAALEAAGHEVVLLVRRESPQGSEAARYRQVLWEGRALGPWQAELDGARAVYNLAGRSVSCKWTPANRRAILDSRVESTRAIGDAALACRRPPEVWINASATGYYGDRGDEAVDERSEPGRGFLADVCRAWEDAIFDHPLRGGGKVALRTGVVLANEGGAFPILRTLAQAFLGGAAGSGGQWMSPIHIDDLVRLYVAAMDGGYEGAVNATMPKPERNRDLMLVLRHRLGRAFGLNAPEWAIRLLGSTLGPDAELALGSTRALPQEALDAGFAFKYGDIEAAFDALLRR